jgi:hypothetical protein
MTKYKILIVFILFLQNTFAQKSEEIKKYKTKKENINFVFVPFFDKEVDKQFIFSLNQGRFKVCDTTKISKNLRNEFLKQTWFKNFVDKLEQNLKTEKNLFESVNENEIKEFKINTLNSDLIYLHSSVEKRTVTKINKSGNVTLYCTIGVYDLESGKLIKKCKIKSKTKFKDALPEENETIITLTEQLFNCLEEIFK